MENNKYTFTNKGDNINLFNALSDKQLGQLSGAKFAYAVAKNLAILQPEINAIKKALEATDEFVKYDAERVKLAESHAKKGEDGKAVKVTNAQGVEEFTLEDKEAFEKAFEVLKEEHKAAINAREAQIKEQNDLLKTESTITLYKIALADVPNTITIEQMKQISEIVEDAILSPFTK